MLFFFLLIINQSIVCRSIIINLTPSRLPCLFCHTFYFLLPKFNRRWLPDGTYLRACWNLLGFVCAASDPRARPNAAAVRAPDIRRAPQCPADKNNRSITVRARVVVVSWLPTQPYQPRSWRHESSGVAEPCAPAPLARAFWRTHAHTSFLHRFYFIFFSLVLFLFSFSGFIYIYIFVFLFFPMSRAHTPKHAHNMTYIIHTGARSPIRTLILLLYYTLCLIRFVFLWYYYYYIINYICIERNAPTYTTYAASRADNTVGGGVAILDSRRGFLLFTRPLPVALNHDYYNTTVYTPDAASARARACVHFNLPLR